MLEKSNSEIAPWTIIDANHKIGARINSLQHILDSVPYK
ncbi:MAG: polyphosphate kinase 2 (PPK2 family) [Psychroserpens sp.]|jgi:polyphosphate kinase 2 (PPK2 family)